MWDLEMVDVQDMGFEEDCFCSRARANEEDHRPRG